MNDRHPLLDAFDICLGQGMTKTELARGIKVTPQSLNTWKVNCEVDRDFLMPAETAYRIAKITGQPLRNYRPDLWPDATWRAT
jgi:hypothetical protein